jgi:hypothetical protein
MNEYAYDEAAMENYDLDYSEDVDMDENFDFDVAEDIDYDEDYDFTGEAARPRRTSPFNRSIALARARAQSQARAKAMQRPQTAPQPRPYFPPTGRQPASTDKVRQGFSRVGTDVSKIKSGLTSLDLNRRVQADLIGRTLKSQSQRITGSEYALASSKIADQLAAQFPSLVSNPIIQTALPLAPLFFLKPQKRGTGFGAVASDPRVWGAGAAFALLGLKEIFDRNSNGSTGASGITTGTTTVGATSSTAGQSPNGTLLQTDLNTLATLLGALTKQVETLAKAAQALPAAVPPTPSPMTQMMQAAIAAQSPEVLTAWMKSLETQQKEQTAEGGSSGSPEQTSPTKSKASAGKTE